MPISNPSYFPAVRGTDQIVGLNAGNRQTGLRVFLAGDHAGDFSTISDLVVIGHNNYRAGITAAGLAGSTVVGSQSYPALTGVGSSVGGSNTVFGAFNAPAAVFSSANVILGSGALTKITSDVLGQNQIQRNVIIGLDNVANAKPLPTSGRSVEQSVIIGYRAAYGAADVDAALFDSVIIGDSACLNYGTAAGNLVGTVVIGAQSQKSLGSASQSLQNTCVGYGQTGLTGGNNNTFVGAGVTVNVNGLVDNTALGANISDVGKDSNLVLGANAQIAGGNADGNILIGAGATLPVDSSQFFVVESTSGLSVRKALFYSDMKAGNLVIGNSTAAVNRDMGGVAARNIVKLLNGVKGGSNPVGGGYFYVIAGALHWVGSGGTDTPIASA